MTMQKTLFKNLPKSPRRISSRGKPDTTQRSLRRLQSQGYVAATAERYDLIPDEQRGRYRLGRRHDLFGFCDVIGLREGLPIVAVQSCQKGEETAHLARYRKWPSVANTIRLWLRNGLVLVIHAWHATEKLGAKGRVKVEWVCVERSVTEEDLQEAKF